jgi:hypothetical protein
MIQRRHNSSVRILPRTVLAWAGLLLTGASLVLFTLAFQPATSSIGQWPALGTGLVGLAAGILAAARSKDLSIVLGILGVIDGTLLLTLLLALTSARPA